MKKAILIAGLALLILVLLGAAGLGWFMYRSAPNYTFERSSTWVKSPVEILFDDMAIPHIYADSEEDAMYALGYVHASERLWQMDLQIGRAHV